VISPSLTGVVLAGGNSSRMGTDKAVLTIDGQSLMDRTIDVLFAVAKRVVVVGFAQSRSEAWLANHQRNDALTFVDDLYPNEGPLGGVLSAFCATETDTELLVVSCDLPLLSIEVLRILAQSTGSNESHVIMCSVNDRLQPLLARYRSSAYEVLQRAFLAGERSLLRAPGLVKDALVLPVDLAAASHDVDTPNEARLLGVDLPHE
jgi:molybdenum cofactor guanylyltransferase